MKFDSPGLSREHIFDLGDATAAGGMEAFLLLWTRLLMKTGASRIQIKFLR